MKKKSGMFKLEPDKFSIHTFEISKKLTNQDYKKCETDCIADVLGERCIRIGIGRGRASAFDAAGFSEMG